MGDMNEAHRAVIEDRTPISEITEAARFLRAIDEAGKDYGSFFLFDRKGLADTIFRKAAQQLKNDGYLMVQALTRQLHQSWTALSQAYREQRTGTKYIEAALGLCIRESKQQGSRRLLRDTDLSQLEAWSEGFRTDDTERAYQIIYNPFVLFDRDVDLRRQHKVSTELHEYPRGYDHTFFLNNTDTWSSACSAVSNRLEFESKVAQRCRARLGIVKFRHDLYAAALERYVLFGDAGAWSKDMEERLRHSTHEGEQKSIHLDRLANAAYFRGWAADLIRQHGYDRKTAFYKVCEGANELSSDLGRNYAFWSPFGEKDDEEEAVRKFTRYFEKKFSVTQLQQPEEQPYFPVGTYPSDENPDNWARVGG